MSAPAITSSAFGASRTRRLAAWAFAETAAFVVAALSTVAIPLTFSIAQADVFALPKTILAVALASVLAGLLVLRWLASGLPIHRPRSALGYAAAIFVVWNLIAWWIAIDRTQATFGERMQYQGLVTTLAYLVYFVAAWTVVRTPRHRTVLLICVAAGASVVATYAILQRAGLDPIWPYLPYGRVFSSIGQANALAAYLVLAILLTIGLAGRRSLPVGVAVAALVVLMLAALALTLSRGGYLGLFAGVAVIAWLVWPGPNPSALDRQRAIASAVVALVVLGVVVSVAGLRAVAEQVVSRAALTADISESSTEGHLDMWAVGVNIVADHPVFGTGQDTYVLLFSQYRDEVLSPERAWVMKNFRPESPHNVHIAVAQGAGLPALVAYWVMVGAVLVAVIRVARSTTNRQTRLIAGVLAGAIIGHLVTDTFMTAETSGSVLFWTALGAGAALNQVDSRALARDQATRAVTPDSTRSIRR